MKNFETDYTYRVLEGGSKIVQALDMDDAADVAYEEVKEMLTDTGEDFSDIEITGVRELPENN